MGETDSAKSLQDSFMNFRRSAQGEITGLPGIIIDDLDGTVVRTTLPQLLENATDPEEYDFVIEFAGYFGDEDLEMKQIKERAEKAKQALEA